MSPAVAAAALLLLFASLQHAEALPCNFTSREEAVEFCAQYEDLYAGIKADLAPWAEEGIDLPLMKRAAERFTTINLQKGMLLGFHKGKAYVIEATLQQGLLGHHANIMCVRAARAGACTWGLPQLCAWVVCTCSRCLRGAMRGRSHAMAQGSGAAQGRSGMWPASPAPAPPLSQPQTPAPVACACTVCRFTYMHIMRELEELFGGEQGAGARLGEGSRG